MPEVMGDRDGWQREFGKPAWQDDDDDDDFMEIDVNIRIDKICISIERI